MKALPFISLLLGAALPVFAQDNPSPAGKISEAYHESRFRETEPTYGLAKVKKLIKAIKPSKSDTDVNSTALSTKVFNALSVQEKFTYCMIHQENSTQNCDMMPAIVGEESKIFAHTPTTPGELDTWSDRQTSFLEKHRESVIELIRATIKAKNQVGLTLKEAIVELDAVTLIPDLVAVYKANHQKDNDILSVCCELMVSGKYKPFMTSQSYRKLYGDENASYKSYIEGNDANKALTIKRAMAFYSSRKA